MELLDKINSPKDLRNLSVSQMNELAEEIREFLITHVASTGGHLSSNLGVVELTLAVDRVFHAPRDKIIWDVGHQTYVHKILTGRRERFDTLRQEGGLSGFPKTGESPYDAFDTGHASTSISVAYGMAKARDLRGEDYHVVAVIGDGSMTGGMAYEAMNNAGKDRTRLIVILNDNTMAINKSTGALSAHLNRLRTGQKYLRSKGIVRSTVNKYPVLRPLYRAADRTKNTLKYLLVKGIIFEELGFTYLGPMDGHDIKALVEVLHQAKRIDKPVLVHVITRKGKGYAPAELNPSKYHGVGSFDQQSGYVPCAEQSTWADLFGKSLNTLAKKDRSIVAITAAMASGVGLEGNFTDRSRLFDVGIAEEHAVTFAAGLAASGMKPCVAIYSTFLQRSYDQILHDVCLPRLPVVFSIDHAGIVGPDGETHQGIFDIAYLIHLPNLTLLSPSCAQELPMMLSYAFSLGSPCAIRYPKGCARSLDPAEFPGLSLTLGQDVPLEMGRSQVVLEGVPGEKEPPVLILAVGDRLEEALKAALLMKEDGTIPTVVNVRFITPMDTELLKQYFDASALILTVEDGVYSGGYGMAVSSWMAQYLSLKRPGRRKIPRPRIRCLSCPDAFLKQGRRADLLSECGLDAQGIYQAWREMR